MQILSMFPEMQICPPGEADFRVPQRPRKVLASPRVTDISACVTESAPPHAQRRSLQRDQEP